jgi:hypothetical protein
MACRRANFNYFTSYLSVVVTRCTCNVYRLLMFASNETGLADDIPFFICKQGKAVPLCYTSVNALCAIALCDAAVLFCDYPPFPSLTLTVFLPLYILSGKAPATGVNCENCMFVLEIFGLESQLVDRYFPSITSCWLLKKCNELEQFFSK